MGRGRQVGTVSRKLGRTLCLRRTLQGYTWAQGESLTDLEKTERREEILRRERERRERLAARRRPRNLAQAFGFSELDDDGEDGCLICHL